MNPLVLNGGIGLALGLVSGGVAGYLVAKKRLEHHYQEFANLEIEGVKKHYMMLRKEDIFSDPENVLEFIEEQRNKAAAQQIIDEVEYGNPSEVDKPKERNIFTMNADELEELGRAMERGDVEVEVDEEEEGEEETPAPRFVKPEDPTIAYVIPIDTYMASDEGYDQQVLTYYAEDDVLCDERDQPIPDVEAVLGTEWQGRFGDGSDDAKVVYVRNDRIETDFEVVLDDRSFEEAVLGVKKEHRPPMRKLRED